MVLFYGKTEPPPPTGSPFSIYIDPINQSSSPSLSLIHNHHLNFRFSSSITLPSSSMYGATSLTVQSLIFSPPMPSRSNQVATRLSVRSALACGPEKNRNASFYEILKVNHTASLTEIKKAYRSLAKMSHPDVAGSSLDGQDFIAIHDAYVTLSDPASRALYDMSLGARRSRRFRSCACPTRRWETDQCW